MPELLKAVRAIHIRRLKALLRDGTQPGKKEHHVVAGVLPEINQHDDVARDIRFEPVNGRRPHRREHAVERSVVAEQHLEYEHHGRDRYDQRADEYRAQRLPSEHRPAERHGEQQRKRHQQGHADAGKNGGVESRLCKRLIGKQRDIVLQPHKTPVHRAGKQRHNKGLYERHAVEQRKPRKARQQEQQSG